MHACLCKLITRRAQLSGIVQWTKAARIPPGRFVRVIARHYGRVPLQRILFRRIDVQDRYCIDINNEWRLLRKSFTTISVRSRFFGLNRGRRKFHSLKRETERERESAGKRIDRDARIELILEYDACYSLQRSRRAWYKNSSLNPANVRDAKRSLILREVAHLGVKLKKSGEVTLAGYYHVSSRTDALLAERNARAANDKVF